MRRAIVLLAVVFGTPLWADGETEEECKASACEKFVRGDVDGDGDVDFEDLSAWLDCVFSGFCPPGISANHDRLDFNDDGQVDGSDQACMTSFLQNGTPPPPSPYPEEGLDPTCDSLDGSCTALNDETFQPGSPITISQIYTGGWNTIDTSQQTGGIAEAVYDSPACAQGTMSADVLLRFPLDTTNPCSPSGIPLRALGGFDFHFEFNQTAILLESPGAGDCGQDCEQTRVDLIARVFRSIGGPFLTIRNQMTGNVEVVYPPWPGPIYGESKLVWEMHESGPLECETTLDQSQSVAVYGVSFEGDWIQDRLCKQEWQSTDFVEILAISIEPSLIHETQFPSAQIKIKDDFRFSVQNVLVDIQVSEK